MHLFHAGRIECVQSQTLTAVRTLHTERYRAKEEPSLARAPTYIETGAALLGTGHRDPPSDWPESQPLPEEYIEANPLCLLIQAGSLLTDVYIGRDLTVHRPLTHNLSERIQSFPERNN